MKKINFGIAIILISIGFFSMVEPIKFLLGFLGLCFVIFGYLEK